MVGGRSLGDGIVPAKLHTQLALRIFRVAVIRQPTPLPLQLFPRLAVPHHRILRHIVPRRRGPFCGRSSETQSYHRSNRRLDAPFLRSLFSTTQRLTHRVSAPLCPPFRFEQRAHRSSFSFIDGPPCGQHPSTARQDQPAQSYL